MGTQLQDYLGPPASAEVDEMNHELNYALLELEAKKADGEKLEAYLTNLPADVVITDARKERMRYGQRMSVELAESNVAMAREHLAYAETKNSNTIPASTTSVQASSPDKISEATIKMVDDGVVKEKALADPGSTIGAADIAAAAGEVAASDPVTMSSAINNLARAKADALTGKAQAKLTSSINSAQSKIDAKTKSINSFASAVNGKIGKANNILGKLGGNVISETGVEESEVTAQDANATGAGIKSDVPQHMYVLFNKGDLSEYVSFTVMPQVAESRTVSYEAVQPAQFPGAFHKFKGTESTTYTITAVFASSTPFQANENLKNLRLLKSWTMPFYGDNTPANKLGAPPPVLLFRGLRGAVGEVPVVITSLSYDWPKDVDYIKAQGSDKDTPFPAIMNVSITLIEGFSVSEFNGFNLEEFKKGDMANAFKAVVPKIESSISPDTALASGLSGLSGQLSTGTSALSSLDPKKLLGGAGGLPKAAGAITSPLNGLVAKSSVSSILSGGSVGFGGQPIGLSDLGGLGTLGSINVGSISSASFDPRRGDAGSAVAGMSLGGGSFSGGGGGASRSITDQIKGGGGGGGGGTGSRAATAQISRVMQLNSEPTTASELKSVE